MPSSQELTPRRNEGIPIGHEFFPFSDLNAVRIDISSKFPSIGTNQLIELQNGKETKLVRTHLTLQLYLDNGLSVVPFNPEAGYIITSEDKDLEKRREKLKSRLLINRQINPLAPFVLLVRTYPDDLIDSGIPFLFGNEQTIVPAVHWQNALLNLYCRVSARGNYEAKIAREGDFLSFDGGFYPLETGYLAADYFNENALNGETAYDDETGELTVGLGHDLLFPLDMEQVSQIGITFNYYTHSDSQYSS